MNLTGNRVSKNEQHGQKIIGKTECTTNALPDLLVGLMTSMGMVNPSVIQQSANKGVSLTKTDKGYIIVLAMYEPPLVINWTGPIDFEKLLEVIDKLIANGQTVAYMNIHNLSKSHKTFQLALA